jgi:hypothetical protein
VTRDAKPARPQQLRQGRRDAQGVSAGLDRARHAAKDRDRGAASRQAAGLRHGGGQKLAPPRKGQPKLQRAGGQKPLGGLQRGDRAKRDSDRGKKSLAGHKQKRQRG